MSFMDDVLTNRVLRELNALLMQHGKLVSDYNLPNFTGDSTNLSIASSLIQNELSIPISENGIMAAQSLNPDQSQAYNRILQSVRQQENVVFFIDGLGDQTQLCMKISERLMPARVFEILPNK
ncbi:hypothetical protein GIB67_032127 [Kingdonia uniflora]|uniref:Uncharacterized protein n=1 Tax=Kingdonia uniflora TaxID=39325 RepID=A0A7J7MWV2_9MAGN|nr:hypothetical protein GIB67_032127 [Kingdonia uniflora]